MPKSKGTVELTLSPRSLEGLRQVGIKLPVVRHLGDGNSVVKWPADHYAAFQQFKGPGMSDDDAMRLLLLVGSPADGTTRRMPQYDK